MKKKNIITAVVSNAVIVILLSVLFLTTVTYPSSTSAFAPIYRGNNSNNKVAVMINVYEGSEYVEQIISILKKYRVSCTFFVGGIWAEKNHDLLNDMAEVAEIGNHGYLHLSHDKLSEKQNEEEIMLCHNLVKEVTGITMTLFAPPSGAFGEHTLSVCENHDYRVIMWSKDTIDWRDHDYELITKRATTDIQSGDLVLMHPTEQTVKALPAILEFYINKNLAPSTVSEVVNSIESY